MSDRTDWQPNLSYRDKEARSYTQDSNGNVAKNVIVGGGEISGTLKPQGLDLGGLITIVDLDDTAWVAMPTSALSERKNIAIQNQSGNGNKVIFNYDNTAPANNGWIIEDGGFKSVLLDTAVVVYCRMASGTGKVCVDEVS